jgi:hypothetical protein
MKLVTLDEFLGLPTGTIFHEYSPHNLGPLMIRGPVRGHIPGRPPDFLMAALTPATIFGNYWSDEPEILPDGTESNPNGLYVIVPEGFGGWGLYDRKIQFLVYEDGDRERLAAWILDPNKAVEQMNDDPHQIIDVRF